NTQVPLRRLDTGMAEQNPDSASAGRRTGPAQNRFTREHLTCNHVFREYHGRTEPQECLWVKDVLVTDPPGVKLLQCCRYWQRCYQIGGSDIGSLLRLSRYVRSDLLCEWHW